jgi:hypothetical protein
MIPKGRRETWDEGKIEKNRLPRTLFSET